MAVIRTCHMHATEFMLSKTHQQQILKIPTPVCHVSDPKKLMQKKTKHVQKLHRRKPQVKHHPKSTICSSIFSAPENTSLTYKVALLVRSSPPPPRNLRLYRMVPAATQTSWYLEHRRKNKETKVWKLTQEKRSEEAPPPGVQRDLFPQCHDYWW